MKKCIIHIKVENKSRHSVETVWENAKDLEHVGYLHSRTNKFFQLMHVEMNKAAPLEYTLMIFRTLRRFHFLSFDTFGFRKIMAPYNLYQLEYIPLLRTTIALNSIVKPSSDPEFPTILLDEVIMEVPKIMGGLKTYFTNALKRHTAIQCSEDEPYRERRTLLKQKRLSFPFSVLNLGQWADLTSHFTERPNTP